MYSLAAVVLAAGFSSRMGAFKPLLPLGDKPLVDWSIDLFRDVGIRRIVVVTGHNREKLEQYLANRDVEIVYNPDYATGMFSSITMALDALGNTTSGFFLLPVDIPLVRSATVKALLRRWRIVHKTSRYFITPNFLGKTGHPPLFDIEHRRDILNWTGEQGLAGYVRQFTASNPKCVHNIRLADRFILYDADTPERLAELEAQVESRPYPTMEEAIGLLVALGAGDDMFLHATQVAEVSIAFAQVLKDRGIDFDIELTSAIALLHDIGKGWPNHAVVGARMAADAGFSGIQDAIALHMDFPARAEEPMTCAELVCLADKYVQGTSAVAMEERFEKKRKLFADNPEALKGVERRYTATRVSHEKLTRLAGRTPEDILAAPSSSPELEKLYDLLVAAR
ncbi:DVU_1551 family NTP transferase [Desulfovibrio inopinatus]|uniref:DVU_1551 family NTP transferase n=1 Tax=Desulfovibrio inopinatus TaxID=102109 RepID=UPI0003FEAEE6|nr:NTP transferase domain-containing protein [Desulfovibrio inopinatus]